MTRVLVTAYGPYDHWRENASWLAMQELTRDLPAELDVTTRLYPVDFAAVRERLESDLSLGFDAALHLGQAPGAGRVALEMIGVNVAQERHCPADLAGPLAPDGPAAYRSELPLAEWSRMIQERGIPATVSFHAGAYLCNAALYLTHYLSERMGLETRAAFFHLPLDTSQAIEAAGDLPSLPAAVSALAVRVALADLADRSRAASPAAQQLDES